MYDIDIEDPAGTIAGAMKALECNATELADRIGTTSSQLSRAKKASRLPSALEAKFRAHRDTLIAFNGGEPATDPSPAVETIAVETLQGDEAIQQRVCHLDQATVARYVEAALDAWTLPPVIVFRDRDGKHWLADGFHRVAAAEHLHLDEIPAEIRKGSRDDALLYAVGANATHGLPRTNDDKRRAVTTMLQHPEYGTWTDRRIADACRVSHPFVGKVREELENAKAVETVSTQIDSEPKKVRVEVEPVNAEPKQIRTTSDGRTVDTSGNRKANQARKVPTMPAKAAEQAMHRFGGACQDLRAAKLETSQVYKVAQLCRDQLIWCLPYLNQSDVGLIIEKITAAVTEGCGNA